MEKREASIILKHLKIMIGNYEKELKKLEKDNIYTMSIAEMKYLVRHFNEEVDNLKNTYDADDNFSYRTDVSESLLIIGRYLNRVIKASKESKKDIEKNGVDNGEVLALSVLIGACDTEVERIESTRACVQVGQKKLNKKSRLGR